MSDALRIDLALARAAGLPSRPANDPGVPRDAAMATAPSDPDALFSPLALLLARFLPPPGTPAPTPTPEEAHLLQDYLRQRVVAVLRDAGVSAPPTLRVSVAPDGALRLAPAPMHDERLAPLLRHDADIATLAAVLHRAWPGDALPAETTGAAATVAGDALPARASIGTIDPRRAWPWRAASVEGGGHDARQGLASVRAWFVGVAAALMLGWWLLG